MAENVAPKAGRKSTMAIIAVGVVVLLVLIFFYWMGAWRGTGGALDEESRDDTRIEQPAPAPTN